MRRRVKVTVYVVVTVYSGVLHEVEGWGTKDEAETYADDFRRELGIVAKWAEEMEEMVSDHTVSVWPLAVDMPDSR